MVVWATSVTFRKTKPEPACLELPLYPLAAKCGMLTKVLDLALIFFLWHTPRVSVSVIY